MRIIFIIASDFGITGGDRVVAAYAGRLRKRGHEVFVISPPSSRPSLREQVRSLLRGRGWIPKAKRQPSYYDHIDVHCQVTDRYRPVVDADIPNADMVVATWWETAEWVANLSEAKGVKVYFVQHHEVFGYLPEDRVKATYSLPLHKITISQWLIDLMRTEYGDRNVSLVPNGVDTEQFYAPPRGKQSIPTVGMVYSTTQWKRCDISLKAFSLAAQKIPNLRLVVFGSGNPSPDLPLPPGAEYVVKPPQDTLRSLYAKCDAWLFSSSIEGFGLPILEAMACRTPVIGTPAGAAPRLLSDGGGVLVQPDDPEDMARAIEWVCNLTDAEWQAMSDAAYIKATSYTWDDATEKFEAALYQAVEQSQRGDISSLGLPKNRNL